MRARLAAALAALAVTAAPAAARDRPAVIEAMTVHLTIGADAAVHVTESVDFEYQPVAVPMYRVIPLRAPDGELVRARDVTASDGPRGAPVAIGVTEHADTLEIRPREALTVTSEGELRLGLSYTLYRALRAGPAGDRLDWLVLPNEWKGDVKRVRVEVRFPPSMPARAPVTATLLRNDGTAVPATVLHGYRMVRIDASQSAAPGESMRLVLVWPSGHVSFSAREPRAPAPAWLRWHDAWYMPAGLLLLIAWIWRAGRSAGRRPVVPIYGPPAGVRPGEAGVIIDGRVDADDIVAAVVDLALRGYVKLERADGETDVTVTVQKPWVSAPDVRPWEAVLLINVFSEPGLPSTRLSALRAPFDTASVREALSADLAERGFFANGPRRVRRIGRWVAVIATAIWFQLGINEGAPATALLAGVATGVALWLLAGVIAAGSLTAEGRRARQTLRGFREFLARADTPRLTRLQAGALDENLAWAIALGVTEGWLAPTPAR